MLKAISAALLVSTLLLSLAAASPLNIVRDDPRKDAVFLREEPRKDAVFLRDAPRKDAVFLRGVTAARIDAKFLHALEGDDT
ncbi:hypothetical protein B0H34DRAFT_791951 [Crassisporium funariophilum]|nr:hypothetical protein B0H34DRAFT_791951 [Crassisporium funariophilum]